MLNDNKMLECCEKVLRYLSQSEAEYKAIGNFNTPSSIAMNEALGRSGFWCCQNSTNMMKFIEYVNEVYGFYEHSFMHAPPEDFHSHRFFSSAFSECPDRDSPAQQMLRCVIRDIRNKKIEDILCQS